MDLASHLGHRILPMLQGWAARLRAEFPRVSAHAGGYADRRFSVSCVIEDAPLDQVDQVALSVSLRELEGELTIVEADVVWDHPSGHVEAEILPAQTQLTPELIEEIAERLPELFAALREAIRRRRPPKS